MGLRPYYKAIAYTMLCIALSMGGSMFSNIIHYIGLPQWFCNFIFGLLITLYAMENLVLFSDLKKCNELLQNKCAYISAIKDLTTSNDSLKEQNSSLTEELRELREMEILNPPEGDTDNNSSIIGIKRAWVFYCDAENIKTPPRIFMSPPINTQNGSKVKVPPIGSEPTL